MKATLLLSAILASAVSAVVLPDDGKWYLRRAEEIDFDQVEIVDMVVTDLDGTDYTGTADSVYHQLIAAGADLSLNVTELQERGRPLDARSGSSPEKRAGENCSWGAYISYFHFCYEGLDYLAGLGKRICRAPATPSGRPAVCARVSCSHTCGMFLCNKVNKPIGVYCEDIGYDIVDIAQACQRSGTEEWQGETRGARDYPWHYIGLGENNC